MDGDTCSCEYGGDDRFGAINGNYSATLILWRDEYVIYGNGNWFMFTDFMLY